MRVKLKTTNFSLTPALDDLVQKKLVLPVEKLISKIDEKSDIIFDVELAKTSKRHQKGQIWRAEAQLSLPGKKAPLRAEAVAESIQIAVNETKNEILREIKKYRRKD